ncbi:nucleotide exchange factor GrpE [Agrococcus sp. ARC_14]|uniref:nucleotide exchange factor GrpE n=1 Tax=Agrococcus sp. ARC_14 TaxID=2919927 RepID=UPI001F054133|nr:nucleotide exchange factor GrpE [Agrococcus sp. ARC_14]
MTNHPSTGSGQGDEQQGDEQPNVTDKRKIDPVTGEPREPAPSAGEDEPAEGTATIGASGHVAFGGQAVPADASTSSAGSVGEDEPSASDGLTDEDRALLEGEAAAIEAERAAFEAKSAAQLDELQRLRAEYVNFRNRTERERAADRESTTASVITSLLPALDDLDLADKHGDLADGPLAIVAAKLRGSFEALGVVKLGELGEVFDIDKHEAVAQLPNPEVTEMVVADVIQPGYRVGDRLLRVAKVAVFVPAE